MDSKTIFSKTAKGLKEVSGATSDLSRALRNILKEIDGRSTLADLQGKLRKLSPADLKQALNDLADNGYIRDPVQEGGGSAAPTLPPTQKPVAQKPVAAAGEDLDFMSMLGQPAAKTEAPPPTRMPAEDQAAAQAARIAAEAQARRAAEEKAKREAEEKAKHEALLKARREAEEKVKRTMAERARLEAEARAKKEAEEKARHEAEEKATQEALVKARREVEEKVRREAEEKARAIAEEKLRREAEEKARKEAEEKLRREAEDKARREAEEKLRREAEEKARLAAEARTRQEAEEKARREADEKARREAEEKARREAEEKAKREAEEKARHEAEEKARREAEEKAKRETEEKIRREAEEKARREAEEKARRAAEERTKREAEEKSKREAEERARREAAEKLRREEEEKVRREAEERIKREAEEKVRREFEARTRKETEENARREAEAQARLDAEQKAGNDAEEKARRDAEAKLQREAEERVSREFEESMRKEAEAQARREAEEKAVREAAEKAKREAEEKARREAEEKARREAGEKAQQEAQQRVRREAEEKVRREAEEKAVREAEEKARREAEEKARQEAEDRANKEVEARARREAEETAKREAEEKNRRKAEQKQVAKMERAANLSQVKWGKLITTSLVLLLVAGLGLIHVISFNGRIPQLEQTAAEQFQQPVKIESIHLSLFPPHWRIEGVSIGKEGQIKVPQIKAMIELSDLFGEAKSFSAVEFDSPVLSEEGLGWILLGRPQGSGFKVDKVRAVKARLDSPSIDLPAFGIQGDIAADGSWQKMSIESADHGVFIELTPRGARVQFEINADSFKMPFGSTLELGAFNAKGTFDRHEMAVTEFAGSVYGGTLSGNAMLRWTTNWSLEGALNAKQVDGKQFIPGLLEKGRIDGRASYVMQARDAKTLFAAPHVEGNYSLGQGALLGVDLTYLLQNGSNTGKTPFRELVGGFVGDGGSIQLKQVRLDAGILSANGSAEVDANNNIHGRFATLYRFDNQQTRGNLVLSGTVSAPKFSR